MGDSHEEFGDALNPFRLTSLGCLTREQCLTRCKSSTT